MRNFALLQSVVLGLLTTHIAAALNVGESRHDCRAHAWVRAPDLEPGQVLRGDVRIKLDGACSDVSSYSIGLRFIERSWVKTKREGVVLPDPPTENVPRRRPSFSNDSIFEPLTFKTEMWSDGQWLEDGLQRSAWETYQNTLRDPTLWLAREEERIGFETRYILREGERLNHELVDHFGILVPFTNYPPAFDMTFVPHFKSSSTDCGDYEHIYAYFVDVKFANGTRHEVPAGFTSFRAAIKPRQSEKETVKVNAIRTSFCIIGNQCLNEKKASHDEFTLEITFPNGRRFEQGSADFVTIITHQTGPGPQRPLRLKGLHTIVNQNLNWAATFAVDNETAKTLLTAGSFRTSQLLPIIDKEMANRQSISEWANGIMQTPVPLQTRALEHGTGFTTDAISVGFQVPQNCYPSFHTYYQTTEVSLEIVLEVQNNPWTKNTLDEEEFVWTPMEEETEHFRATIPIFIHTNPRTGRPSEYQEPTRLLSPYPLAPLAVKSQPRNDGAFEDQEPIHYLSSGARAPAFVDPSSISELQQKSRDDRDQLAPTAQGIILLAPVDRGIVKHRYFDVESAPRGPRETPPYYVGDTSLRKVLAKSSEKDGWRGRENPGEVSSVRIPVRSCQDCPRASRLVVQT